MLCPAIGSQAKRRGPPQSTGHTPGISSDSGLSLGRTRVGFVRTGVWSSVTGVRFSGGRSLVLKRFCHQNLPCLSAEGLPPHHTEAGVGSPRTPRWGCRLCVLPPRSLQMGASITEAKHLPGFGMLIVYPQRARKFLLKPDFSLLSKGKIMRFTSFSCREG